MPARFHEWPAIWLLLPSIVMSPFYLFSQKRISNYFKLLSLKSISLMHLGMALMIFLLWTLMSTFLAIYSGGVGPENLFSAATSIEKVWMIVLIVIPIYSLTNALGEEIVFRGIFLSESWKKLRLPLMTPLIIQALLFASYQNILGIQSGILGLILSFSVGFSLGLLRLQSANLSLAIIANFLQSFVSSLVLTLMLV